MQECVFRVHFESNKIINFKSTFSIFSMHSIKSICNVNENGTERTFFSMKCTLMLVGDIDPYVPETLRSQYMNDIKNIGHAALIIYECKCAHIGREVFSAALYQHTPNDPVLGCIDTEYIEKKHLPVIAKNDLDFLFGRNTLDDYVMSKNLKLFWGVWNVAYQLEVSRLLINMDDKISETYRKELTTMNLE